MGQTGKLSNTEMVETITLNTIDIVFKDKG